MDFKYIHIYRSDRDAGLCIDKVKQDVAELFGRCEVDVREPFLMYWDDGEGAIDETRIFDLKQPFEKQPGRPEPASDSMPLYDGFMLQRTLAQLISDKESHADHVHLVFTHLMTCTFAEEDWRYHGRAVICGTPSIVSVPGIVEAPAKPREFYHLQALGSQDLPTLKKQFAGRFVDYDDGRMTKAAVGYAIQALFYFVTDGEPFCDDRDCRLFNSHWQEDLIRTQVEKPRYCRMHGRLASKFKIKSE
ncbi:MAG TPA: DUF6775 family putative metallopeptidase [Nitrososphaera sp.]